MFIARKGDTTTLGPKGRQTYEPLGRRPIHLENLSLHNPRGEAPSTLTPKVCPMLLFFQYAAEGVFFSVFSVFHVDALDFRGEAGEGVDAVY